MRIKQLLLPVTFILTALCLNLSAQETGGRKGEVDLIIDSLARNRIVTKKMEAKPDIRFTREQAVRYLNENFRSGNWADPVDPFRMAMGQLVYSASHPPLDSAILYFKNYNFDSISIPWEKFFIWDSLNMKIPVVIPQDFIVRNDSIVRGDTISPVQNNDTLTIQIAELPVDTVSAYRPMVEKPTVIMKDTVFMFIKDTLAEVLPDRKGVPFLYYKYPYQVDSIAVAIRTLSDYLVSRDSSVIQFNSISGAVIPVWLNSSSGNMTRYWLRNEFSDSVTVWIGSTGRDSVGLFLRRG
jgi:hypothetical protein